MAAELTYLQKKYHVSTGDPAPRFRQPDHQKHLCDVLAGGRGSRLHQLTDWRAKPRFLSAANSASSISFFPIA